MKAPHKILIIRLSSLGDILHTLPAFYGLKEAYPQAQIDWLVDKNMSFLLSAVCGINEIIEIDLRAPRKSPGMGHAWKSVLDTVRKLRQKKYDISVDFQGLLKTAILGLACGARTRFGFAKEVVRERPAHWFYHRLAGKKDQRTHVVELNKQLASAAGAGHFPESCKLRVFPKDEIAVKSRLQEEEIQDFLVLNPGGGWPTKVWKPSKYALLSDLIQSELKLPVVVKLRVDLHRKADH